MSIEEFLKGYETANNSHNIEQVRPYIAENASYFFTDGTYIGLENILKAIQSTFNKIKNEKYQIFDIFWVLKTDQIAVCRYKFKWSGVVGGKSESGSGRGTNVIQRVDGAWKMTHEHLSS